MTDVPLSVSPDGIKWIVDMVRLGDADTDRAGQVPALCFFLDFQTCDQGGRLIERCSDAGFFIGWYDTAVATAHGFVQLDVAGVKVFAAPDTLNRLKGMQLILETVEVGYPTPADKKEQMLRAVPRGS